MNGEINLLTLVSLIIAIVAIVKLRSVLGRRTSDDEARIDKRQRELNEIQRQSAASGSDKVVALPKREPREKDVEAEQPQTAATAVAEAEDRIRTFSGSNAALADDLLKVSKLDPDFDPDSFMKGAKIAYEMIVTAFAEGNKRTLRDLLAPDVFESFSRAITEREGRGEQIDQSFVGINKADLLEAELNSKKSALMTVRFQSQIISATRDRAGKVIDGDDQRVKDVTDIWTFARDISSKDALRDLNWKLVATQAPN